MWYFLLCCSEILYVVNNVLIHISSETCTYFFECRVVDWVVQVLLRATLKTNSLFSYTPAALDMEDEELMQPINSFEENPRLIQEILGPTLICWIPCKFYLIGDEILVLLFEALDMKPHTR